VADYSSVLNPTKALIWRITHRANVPWILDNGLHCKNSVARDPHFVPIGNEELIERRSHRVVPIAPGGTLSDYVPFYFTPFSPMMYNIHTGYGGITRRSNDDIVIFVASLPRIHADTRAFVFTDRHAYPPLAVYFNTLNQLGSIDWPLLQRRDFTKDPDDPVKVERYQAEALIHRHVPIAALAGVICYSAAGKAEIEQEIASRGLDLEVRTIPGWYF
jgi:hypothetical protein